MYLSSGPKPTSENAVYLSQRLPSGQTVGESSLTQKDACHLRFRPGPILMLQIKKSAGRLVSCTSGKADLSQKAVP